MKTISAGNANRHFPRLLRDVVGGETITVLSWGKPVATIAPAHSSDDRKTAKQRLLKRLLQQQPLGARDWNRAELYANE
ncbi:MAG: type II toxin-antitoxin system Phd/YefM family antitoxin [Candidatus Accumulibacter sp.]|jgi:antitoxin (DNA-binding transcriptional repressor) of toxin-antitoxin stability system|nr:type II toxin-antitoxin system Phd/YefM family antitoxin [Accumulibacter sp.]